MSLLRNFKIVIDNQGVVIGELTALGPELLPRRAGASQVSSGFSAVVPTASLANNAMERSRILVTVRAYAYSAPSIRLAHLAG
jgi:hypothetical protein